MSKYILFGFSYYYPDGGAGDIIGCFDTLEEAFIFFESLKDESGDYKKISNMYIPTSDHFQPETIDQAHIYNTYDNKICSEWSPYDKQWSSCTYPIIEDKDIDEMVDKIMEIIK